ncbi:MAG: hypothetical protein V3V75_04615 [Thermoguttaceae bacterium]
MAPNKTHKFNVRFRKQSSGEETASLGVTVPREDCSPTLAEELFLKAQLKVVASADPHSEKDADGQQTMGDEDNEAIAAVVEVKAYGRTNRGWGFTMSLPVTAVPDGELQHVAGKRGTLTIQRVGSVADKRTKK